MFTQSYVRSTLLALIVGSASIAEAAAPDHFQNPKENINPDPNYVPGDFAPPEAFAARTAYAAAKAELVKPENAANANRVMTLGVGEVTFSAAKNIEKSVLGYFRNYFGVAEMGKKGLTKMTMIVDINSLDTAVPGRNNRITKIFFDSEDAAKGMATIEFTQFKSKGMKALAKGSKLTATGTIELNGMKKPISADLSVKKKGTTWMVETAAPIKVMVSDFGYEKAAMALMKSCNHTHLGNAVDVKVKLFFR